MCYTSSQQKIRDPEFGSDLVKYLYEPSDATTFDKIKAQIRSDISARVPNVTFDDMKIIDSVDDHTKIVSILYTITKGNVQTQNNVAIKI